MKVSENQQIGTFLGLEQGLVLVETLKSSENLKKKLIVPHGLIQIIQSQPHQKVCIKYNKPRAPSNFIYEVDSRMKILKAGESLSA